MRLTVSGCGDAFGSGGRLQTSYHVERGDGAFLIDCGATSLIGMERCGLDPNRVGTILISHLHGDHFAGLVWWYLHSVHVAKRTRPLEVVGPTGVEQRFRQAAEALFPGSLAAPPRFAMRFVEQRAGIPLVADGGAITVTAFEVNHPSGAPSHALRIETAGRTIAFSGDTEWVEALVPCAREADLFVCECYAYDEPSRYHMCWSTLEAKLPQIGAKRVVLTHMNRQMLRHAADVVEKAGNVALAADGMVIDL